MKTESDHLKFDVGDFYDSASSDRERELSLSLSQRDRQKLNQIEDALKRLEAKTYGQCLMCKDLISEDRLKVCLLYTSPSPRAATLSRMPSSA